MSNYTVDELLGAGSSSPIADEDLFLEQHNDVPLNIPAIRMWELDENSTHYDRMIAAPSDHEIAQFWKGWSSILVLTVVVTTGTLLPLLFTRSIRNNTFNFYLIFLIIPDMLWAWLCESTCLSNLIAGRFTSAGMCKWQSFYGVFAITANSWMNLVVAQQLYRMLTLGQRFRRYKPPSGRLVLGQAMAVYAYAVFLASMSLFDAPWWPHKTRLAMGAFCIPMDYDTKSTVVFYTLFFPLLFGIPLLYVCWVAYQIYHSQLLPAQGRRRVLAIYFFRLFAVFVVMWLPALILMFVTSPFMDPWFQFAGGAWSHMQGVTSAVVSWFKPDIWNAVYGFWTCKRLRGGEEDDEDKRESFSNLGASGRGHGRDDDDDDASVMTVGFGSWKFVPWNIMGVRNSSTTFQIDEDELEAEIKRISAVKIEWDAELMGKSVLRKYEDAEGDYAVGDSGYIAAPTSSRMFSERTDDSGEVPLGWSDHQYVSEEIEEEDEEGQQRRYPLGTASSMGSSLRSSLSVSDAEHHNHPIHGENVLRQVPEPDEEDNHDDDDNGQMRDIDLPDKWIRESTENNHGQMRDIDLPDKWIRESTDTKENPWEATRIQFNGSSDLNEKEPKTTPAPQPQPNEETPPKEEEEEQQHTSDQQPNELDVSDLSLPHVQSPTSDLDISGLTLPSIRLEDASPTRPSSFQSPP